MRISRAILALSFTGLLASAQQNDAVLEGVVRNALTGAPIPGAEVSLSVASGNGRYSRITSGDTGQFRFESVQPGEYTLATKKLGYADSYYAGAQKDRVTVIGGTAHAPLDLKFLPTGTIEGRVLDGANKPVNGVNVYAKKGFGPALLATTAGEGSYRLEYLAAGGYQIEIGIPEPIRRKSLVRDPDSGRVSAYPERRLADNVPVEAGSSLGGFDLKLRREPVVEVNGRLVDSATREPLAGAKVELFTHAGAVTTAADGKFHFDLIQPGPQSLLVYREPKAKQPPFVTSINLGSSGIDDLVVVVPQPVRVEGKVSGAKVRGAVRLSSAINNAVGEIIDLKEDGSFVFEGVTPGQWRLNLMAARSEDITGFYIKSIRAANEDASSYFTVLESAGPPIEIVISDKVASILGRIAPELAHSRVTAKLDTGRVYSAEPDADGSFVMRGLRPGHYEITVGELAKPIKLDLAEGDTASVLLSAK